MKLPKITNITIFDKKINRFIKISIKKCIQHPVGSNSLPPCRIKDEVKTRHIRNL